VQLNRDAGGPGQAVNFVEHSPSRGPNRAVE
jgi:hypothetical protein